MTQKIDVFQFTRYDISTDQVVKSRRWGTREAINNLGGGFVILESTRRQVDPSAVVSDHPGLTAIGFNPDATSGFPRQVKG